MFYPMIPSVPGTDFLITLDVSYGEELTDEFIQDTLADLVNQYMVAPTYLFVSRDDYHTLRKMVMVDDTLRRMMFYHTTFPTGYPSWPGDIYPNRVTGRHLKIVEFPDLPEKTLRLAGYYRKGGEIVREF